MGIRHPGADPINTGVLDGLCLVVGVWEPQGMAGQGAVGAGWRRVLSGVVPTEGMGLRERTRAVLGLGYQVGKGIRGFKGNWCYLGRDEGWQRRRKGRGDWGCYVGMVGVQQGLG